MFGAGAVYLLFEKEITSSSRSAKKSTHETRRIITDYHGPPSRHDLADNHDHTPLVLLLYRRRKGFRSVTKS